MYVEFRSVVQALGFKLNYDKVKKMISASSEDTSINIDLKSGATYVDGMQFEYGREAPIIINSGSNILVMAQLFHATGYFYADYNSEQRIIKVYDDPWGMPKKADMRNILSVIEAHYPTGSVKNFELQSWGTYVTVSANITIRKSGAELLDRVEHATIEMEREDGGRWTIHAIQSETEYLNYQSLLQQEVSVPEADKLAIIALLEANIKAINEKNAEALVATLNPDAPLSEYISSREELQLLYQYQFLKTDYECVMEKYSIVAYESNKATIYTVSTNRDKKTSKQIQIRNYNLISVVKSSDGKWYMNPNSGTLLASEVL
ncbi:MAG: stalk domain-containing protein [Candidatus Cohnella colombiensis]|uniref:Stalk domain-containing protein n=1 Tax=Candidatus Cohnella colombiensis TaxID=3121368 RepID=A0AA95EVW2_9BACL|nr:MAG: stalk domain-containing protein [Cohnella sp.]